MERLKREIDALKMTRPDEHPDRRGEVEIMQTYHRRISLPHTVGSKVAVETACGVVVESWQASEILLNCEKCKRKTLGSRGIKVPTPERQWQTLGWIEHSLILLFEKHLKTYSARMIYGSEDYEGLHVAVFLKREEEASREVDVSEYEYVIEYGAPPAEGKLVISRAWFDHGSYHSPPEGGIDPVEEVTHWQTAVWVVFSNILERITGDVCENVLEPYLDHNEEGGPF